MNKKYMCDIGAVRKNGLSDLRGSTLAYIIAELLQKSKYIFKKINYIAYLTLPVA